MNEKWLRIFWVPALVLALGFGGCSQRSSGSSSSGGSSSSTSSGGSSGGSSSSSSGGTVTGPDPSTASFPSTGVPDQNSFTLVADVLNPRARNYVGTTVNITVRLADQLGNDSTIADGTTVYFAAEGGAIESQCMTTGGTCSVVWTSQNPYPPAGTAIADPLGSADTIVGVPGNTSAARATILAWTLGSESFIDNNSNGLYDDGDIRDPNEPDRGEPFLDRNEDGIREVNEEFVNFPIPQLGSGGTYDGPDGLYSGPNCAHSTECATGINAQSTFIYDTLELAMSSDLICIIPVDLGPGYWDATVAYAQPVDLKNVRNKFNFLITDCFGNPPMNGTTVEITSAVGEVYADTGTIPNTNVDVGTAVTGSRVPKRERYPLSVSGLVYKVEVQEDVGNAQDKQGALKVLVSNDVGTATYVVQLYDPMN